VHAADGVARNIVPHPGGVGRHLQGAPAGAAGARGRPAGQAQVRQVDDGRVDQDRLALGMVKGHAKEAQGIASAGLPRTQGKEAALAADALCAPVDDLLSVGAAHRAGRIARQVRMVVDLDPGSGEQRAVLQRKALFQQVADVGPAVVLLAGQEQVPGYLPRPDIAPGQGAAGHDQEAHPHPAGHNDLQQQQQGQQAGQPALC